jgi:hypothetical protein
MRNAGKLLIVAVALFSSSAWAGPLALWVGQTSFFGFPGRNSQVEVSNPFVVEVTTSKSGAEIRGLLPGTSKVTLRLKDGDTYEFVVHVTPKGSEVYSTSRAESEHAGFDLNTAYAGRTKEPKRSAVASTSQDTGSKQPVRTAKRATKKSTRRA